MKSLNGDKFFYSSYWRTWSRILAPMNTVMHRGTRLGQIEVDLTAVNGTSLHGWPRVARVNIRVHRTSMHNGDIVTDVLPEHRIDLMQQMLGDYPVLIERLLHDDLIPLIEWDKYNKVSNGGAALADILKDQA